MSIEIDEVLALDREIESSLAGLLPQLSASAALAPSMLEAVVRSADSHLYLARFDDEIIGTLTLAFYRTPTGIRAWIEDVVVDRAARGHGVGALLVEEALSRARQTGAASVNLTSRASREAANRLYQRLGFELRETNVYRFEL